MSKYKTIEELLRAAEDDIQCIKKRFYVLDGILKQFKTVIGNQPFRIMNDILWNMVVDSYEMLIIDLASLYKGMCESSGFFGQLNNYSSALRTKSHRKMMLSDPIIIDTPEQPMSEAEKKRIAESIKTIFGRRQKDIIEKNLCDLFPELEHTYIKKANQNLINNLKDHFRHVGEEVVHDRDVFRAHRYEKESEHKNTELRKDINLSKIEKHFKYIEDTIKKIRLIATQISYQIRNTNFANIDKTSEDIVDMIMMGSINHIFNKFKIPEVLAKIEGTPKYYYQYRNAFYATCRVDDDEQNKG